MIRFIVAACLFVVAMSVICNLLGLAAYLVLRRFPVSRGSSLDRFYLGRFRGYGIFLHRIHASDPQGIFHNHPWNGLSLILGGYKEQHRDSIFQFFDRRWVNWIRAEQFHRVMVTRPTWTLFIHGPKCNTWAITNERGESVAAPWKGADGQKDYTKALNG